MDSDKAMIVMEEVHCSIVELHLAWTKLILVEVAQHMIELEDRN